MPTRIELLKQAGFSDDEIGDWARGERQQMQAAGYTDGEVDERLGITRPPVEVPPAFIERLKQGNWMYRILGAAGEYAHNYFGEEPLGFSPEHQRLLGKFGVIGDLTAAAGGPVDALLRSIPAGVGAIGAGAGQAFEEAHDAAFGPGPYAKGKAARDFAQLAQVAALLSGAKGPKTGPARAPIPNIANGPVIELPRAQDFRNAAASISGAPASYQVEQKLLRLWKEQGIHPNEVAADAMHDRAIAETVRSGSEELPQVYAGAGKTGAPGTPEAPVHAAEPRPSDEGLMPIETAATNDKSAVLKVDDRSSADPGVQESADTIEESKSILAYNPPRVRQRPFRWDYPKQARTDAKGKLLEDIEGRPLIADFTAGRRFAGKPDEPISPEDMQKAMLPLDISFTPMSPLAFPPGTTGYFMRPDPRGKPKGGYIFVDNSRGLPAQEISMAHEFGHAIDHFAKYFSDNLTPEEIGELRLVYGTLRTSPKYLPLLRQPESFRYQPDKVNRELVAEGLRAYMANPNYFKTMAPKAAAKIRAVVNSNDRLKRVIQFNSLLAAGLIGAGARNQDKDDR